MPAAGKNLQKEGDRIYADPLRGTVFGVLKALVCFTAWSIFLHSTGRQDNIGWMMGSFGLASPYFIKYDWLLRAGKGDSVVTGVSGALLVAQAIDKTIAWEYAAVDVVATVVGTIAAFGVRISGEQEYIHADYTKPAPDATDFLRFLALVGLATIQGAAVVYGIGKMRNLRVANNLTESIGNAVLPLIPFAVYLAIFITVGYIGEANAFAIISRGIYSDLPFDWAWVVEAFGAYGGFFIGAFIGTYLSRTEVDDEDDEVIDESQYDGAFEIRRALAFYVIATATFFLGTNLLIHYSNHRDNIAWIMAAGGMALPTFVRYEMLLKAPRNKSVVADIGGVLLLVDAIRDGKSNYGYAITHLLAVVTGCFSAFGAHVTEDNYQKAAYIAPADTPTDLLHIFLNFLFAALYTAAIAYGQARLNNLRSSDESQMKVASALGNVVLPLLPFATYFAFFAIWNSYLPEAHSIILSARAIYSSYAFDWAWVGMGGASLVGSVVGVFGGSAAAGAEVNYSPMVASA